MKKFIWFFATFCHSGKTTLLDCLLLFHVQYQVCVREVTLGCHDKNLNLAVRAAEVIFCNVFHKISHVSAVFLYQQVGGLLLQLSFVPLAWGPELGWDPRSILTVAEKSRVVTSLHLLFFFYLLSSLYVSHCRGRWFTWHQSELFQFSNLILVPMEKAALFRKQGLKTDHCRFIPILLPLQGKVYYLKQCGRLCQKSFSGFNAYKLMLHIWANAKQMGSLLQNGGYSMASYHHPYYH